ncbi:MAG TPA: transcriptional regulator [Polyangiaceae bacterium]
MSQDRRRVVITRLMQLAIVLHAAKRGLTVRQLMERLERSKSTIHRDLESLRFAGIGVQTDTVNGEVRYSLPNWPVAAITPTPLQLTALCLARETLGHLDGTAVVNQLDAMLSQWGRLPKAQLALTYRKREGGQTSVVTVLDDAITNQQRLELTYQGEHDQQSRQRKVEPVALRATGEQLYLFAYDVERQDYRMFKAARVQNAKLLPERSGDHSQVNIEKRFAYAIKTWTADSPTTVVVRISPEKARFVAEYPLMPTQRVTTLDDGRVEVTAEVNGVTEALNWVLGWGAHAEAMSPAELRERVAEQVRDAARQYGDPSRPDSPMRKTRGEQAVSPELGHGGRRVAG